MKRISSLIACGVIALGFATSSNAQLRGSSLIITNSTGTVKMTMSDPTATGVCLDQFLTLCRPGNPLSTITLIAPATNGARNFAFPETGGTLLTSNSDIDASQITNLSTVIGGSMPTIAGNTTINVTTDLSGDYTIGLNLNNPNTWTAVQTFLANEDQGNVFVNSINNASLTLTNYVTLADFNTSITNLQTSITNLTNASTNYLEVGDISVTSPLTATPGVGSVTLGMSNSGVTAGTYTNANITVDAFGRVTTASNGAVNSATYTQPQLTNSQTPLSSDVAGKSYVELSSNHNGNANGRQFTLPSGVNGQIMLLRNTAGNCELNPNAGNLLLKTGTTFAMNGEAHILLYWSGLQWIELSRLD